MFQGLKIAAKRQKRLLFLFFITIFIPSVALSIFGIKALRSEKYRIRQEVENEQYRIASNIKSNFGAQIAVLEEKLLKVSAYLPLQNKGYNAIGDSLRILFEDELLIEHLMFFHSESEPVFPLFYFNFNIPPTESVIVARDNIQRQIQLAEDFEFRQNNYLRAASIYNELFKQVSNSSLKARILSNRARNLYNAGRIDAAVSLYSNIINDYPDVKSALGLPLELQSRLQIIECQQKKDDTSASLTGCFVLMDKLLINKWNLTENQFNTYSSMVLERITEILDSKLSLKTEFQPGLDQVREKIVAKNEQWTVINNIRSSIIPELRTISLSSFSISPVYRLSRRIADENYLVIAVPIPGLEASEFSGILAVKLNNKLLENEILDAAVLQAGASEHSEIFIRSLNGERIKGNQTLLKDGISLTSFFDNNFPPWQLELNYTGPGGMGKVNLVRSFYFWTIITLMIILVFGTVIVGRTVVREMELLKIKSDFVSSVSHEFKTPLTSMKALTERLQEGKVNEPNKLQQYISLISHDIDRLIRLVSNILNFSRIEEGKKVYSMESTDISAWIAIQVEDHKKENHDKEYDINLHKNKDLPNISIDRDAIGQVLFNLLDNAVKFSVARPEIEVNIREEKKGILIKIKDKGIGINQDEREQIFEKFYRGGNAVKYSIKGTGLGLAFVKHTIEAHNGSIELSDEKGWSTVFSIWLPLI